MPSMADATLPKREEPVNGLLVLMVLGVWFLMNHHGWFTAPP
jgi:hypothetical protein